MCWAGSRLRPGSPAPFPRLSMTVKGKMFFSLVIRGAPGGEGSWEWVIATPASLGMRRPKQRAGRRSGIGAVLYARKASAKRERKLCSRLGFGAAESGFCPRRSSAFPVDQARGLQGGKDLANGARQKDEATVKNATPKKATGSRTLDTLRPKSSLVPIELAPQVEETTHRSPRGQQVRPALVP